MPSSTRRRSLAPAAANELSTAQEGPRSRSSSRPRRYPATIDSSTHITEEKIMHRRKSRRLSKQERNRPENKEQQDSLPQQRQDYDKENQSNQQNLATIENLVLSPTPYWKVAKERGMSPRATRSSCKKKKKQLPEQENEAQKEDEGNTEDDQSRCGVVLNFSPPDNVANERREKEEVARKEKDRANRVQNAKDQGQLLIFSPTSRNLASIPAEAKTGNASPMLLASSGKENQNQSNLEEKLTTPQKMNVEFHRASESTRDSSDLSHAQSEHIVSELRSLRESVNKLVEPRIIETPSKSVLRQQQIARLSLEAQTVRSESLTMAKTKLESKNEKLQSSVKELETSMMEERAKFVLEKARLESELSSANRESAERIKGLEELKRDIQNQLVEVRREKEAMVNQVSKLQADAETAKDKLEESKKKIKALKDERDAETRALDENNERFSRMSEELSGKIKENKALSCELRDLKMKNDDLQQRLEEYEEKINALENNLLPESEAQLEEALDECDRHRKALEDTKKRIAEYESIVNALKDDLEQARLENERERSNFEILNKDSSEAFEIIKKDKATKDAQIRELNKELLALKRSLEERTKELQRISRLLENSQSDMSSRLHELEKSLKEALVALEKSTQEKMKLEQDLSEALKQIQRDIKFKEDVLNKNNQTSASLRELDSERTLLSRRIDEMERKLRQVSEQRDEALSRMESSDDREKELFHKLRESDRVRRDLHNRVIQLSGNIRVYVRVRPTLLSEMIQKADIPKSGMKKRKHNEIEDNDCLFRYPGIYDRKVKKSTNGADDLTKNLIEMTEPYKDRGGLSERRKRWTFGFDHVFNPDHGQDEIWEATEPLVQSAVDGYNVTIFAYGQTGSGKTYTMLGEAGNEGIISRSVKKLFEAKHELEELSQGGSTVELSVELLEVYNEKVRDLLADGTGSDGKELSLRVTSDEVVGNICRVVNDEKAVAKILDFAQKRRCVKATASNAVSSRSHMLFTIHFKVISKNGINRSGKLNVCDLAGSERLNKSKTNSHAGALLTETKHINSSLSTLSNVIEKLQAQDTNVPFRESKLTFLLQNSLGGNSKTLAIVCCSPAVTHFHESLCSLRFAAKVNKVDLKAVANFSC